MRPIIKEFLALRGGDKGRMIGIASSADTWVWPTKEEFDKMTRDDMKMWHSRAGIRARYVLQAIQKVAGQKTFGHYAIAWVYAGSGRILAYWRFLRVKAKKVERMGFGGRDCEAADLNKPISK